MALQAWDKRLREENEALKSNFKHLSLMIASQREPDMDGRTYQDKTTYPKETEETEGQKLEKKGGYIDTGELDSGGKPLMIQGMPPAIDPEEHKRLQKQKKIRGIAEEGATEGERQAGRGKLKDKTQLPNFFKAIIDAKPNPADLLKILQFLPALTGVGLGQLAHVNEDGTAHDWRAPDHGGIPVPGGEVNPHGRRGTNTFPDGRQKYTPEELKQIDEYMKSLMISSNPSFEMAGPNYGADKRKYGASDAILNPDGKFNKPTLDMLIKHAANYPKA